MSRILRIFPSILFVAMFCHCPATLAQSPQAITYRCTADGTLQPAMFYAPESESAVPLVVALHTWSADWRQTHHQAIARWCIEKGWAYIHPNFRGPNRRPEATGSELVVQDIIDAVEHAKRAAKIDTRSIYLVGTSGGGYTAILMAGRHPKIWAGVSAWVPISDLAAWYRECKASGRKYAADIVASCGGAPGDSEAIDQQYKNRSPLTHLARAKDVPLHIGAGIHDGHTGSVPVSHSLRAFNRVAQSEDRFSDTEIDYMVKHRKIPAGMQTTIIDPSYGNKRPLLRRTSGAATVTIFEGGHELVTQAAISWIEALERHKDSSN